MGTFVDVITMWADMAATAPSDYQNSVLLACEDRIECLDHVVSRRLAEGSPQVQAGASTSSWQSSNHSFYFGKKHSEDTFVVYSNQVFLMNNKFL